MSEYLSVRPVAIVKPLLLRIFHKISEFNTFPVLTIGKNFTRYIINLPRNWLIARGCKARYWSAKSHGMRTSYKLRFSLSLSSRCSVRGISLLKGTNGSDLFLPNLFIGRLERINSAVHFRVQSNQTEIRGLVSMWCGNLVNVQYALYANSLKNIRSTLWLFYVAAKLMEGPQAQIILYRHKRQKDVSLSPLSGTLI